MPCALCGQQSFLTVSTVDAKSSEHLHVAACQMCSLVQQQPIPTEQDRHLFYTHHYRTEYKNAYVPKAKHVYRAGRSALTRLQFLSACGIRSGVTLDIGAGGGEFVYMANRLGFEAVGIEPNIGYSEYATREYGVNVLTGDVRTAKGPYDLITMFHVLEHVADPLGTLKTLWGLLQEGGHLFLEVPNIEANDASPHNIFFTAHVFYFSQATLISCASQYFEPVAIHTKGNMRILFKKKDPAMPSPALPNHQDAQKTLRRVRQKGWLEYLLFGGGIYKPFVKLSRTFRERRFRHISGKRLLDTLSAEHVPHTPQANNQYLPAQSS